MANGRCGHGNGPERTEKYCPACDTVKPRSEWGSNKSRHDGLHSICRQCAIEKRKAHAKANPEKKRANNARWYQSRKDRVADMNKKRYAANAEDFKRRARECREKLKAQVFDAYGGYVCNCCGETEPTFLTIDHVNNDGNEHRRQLAGKNGTIGNQMYRWLIDNGFPEGFQILCYNCNIGKYRNGGICPHKARQQGAA